MDFQENLVSFPVRNLRIRHFFSQQNFCGTGCSSRLEASKNPASDHGLFWTRLELRKPEQCHHPCRRVLKVLSKWSFFWKYKWIQQGDISCIYPNHVSVHPRSLTAWPWKKMVGRLLSFWGGFFSGAMWNFQGVSFLAFAMPRQFFSTFA